MATGARKGISLRIEVSQPGKYYRSMQMRVGAALKQVLDEERQKQLIAEVMEPVFMSLPIAEDACVRGLLISIATLKKLLLQPQTVPADETLSASQQQDDETAMTVETLSNDTGTDNIQQKLIKEVLESLAEEGKLWLEHHGKEALPACLPQEEEGLQNILEKVNTYLQNPDTLLNLIKEDEANKSRIAALAATLTGMQPPYRAGLSAMEWNDLVHMICTYLVEEGDTVYYRPPLIAYVDDDYLTEPATTTFSDQDTIRVCNYVTGITLYCKDAEDQIVELSANNFPYIAGTSWYPGFTIDIKGLEENEVRKVKVCIPKMDTFQLYVVKPSSELEMDGKDILALLSSINKAQKNGDETKVSLSDVEVAFREGTEKDTEIAVLKFKGIESGKSILEITVEKKDHPFLEWYLLGKKPIFKIATTKIENDDYITLSSFTINRGAFSGYFLERPQGTTAQERTEGSYKRIPEGRYDMCYTYKSCRPETTRSNADNETWMLTNGVQDATGAIITRNYVLIHIGNYPWNSAGCLLIGGNYQSYTLAEDYYDKESDTYYEKDLVIKMVTSSGNKLTALNNEYNKLIDLTKQFDDDCQTNKCYEMEIEINR